MRITLDSIKLSNFKGIVSFETRFGGNNTDILGENETGKTSIMDAWLWLLFDRDSRGYKGAEVAKTMNGSDYVHNLDHEVEATITVFEDKPAGRTITLRKMLRENWVKPRGKSEAVYSGNVTSFWVDDVPYQAGQYKEFINGLMPESLFNVLSDSSYFCESLHWKDRLSILLDMAGKVSPEEVAGDDAELLSLINRIGPTKTMDEYKKMLIEQVKRLNKELEEIPVRISEVGKSIVTEDWQAVETRIAALQAQIDSISKQETDAAEAIKPLKAMFQQHSALEAKRVSLIKGLVYAANADRDNWQQELEHYKRELEAANRAVAEYQNKGKQILARIEALKEENNTLRTDLANIDREKYLLSATTFDETSINPNVLICPTCHQDLPAGDINAKVEQMKANFEQDIKKQISALDTKRESTVAIGRSNNSEIKWLNEQMDTNLDLLAEEMKRQKTCNERAAELSGMIDQSKPMAEIDFVNHPDVKVINSEIQALERNIDAFVQPEHLTNHESLLKDERAKTQDELNALRDRLYARSANEKAAQRMTELRETLKAKGAEKTILEGDLYAIERFVVRNTQAMESRINAMFTDVSFKLFKELINGGIEECCDAVVNGTTFGKANTAGQINAGLDIIEAISKHKNIHVPVFIDHAESVTSMNNIEDTQMIRLVVSYNTPITVVNH